MIASELDKFDGGLAMGLGPLFLKMQSERGGLEDIVGRAWFVARHCRQDPRPDVPVPMLTQSFNRSATFPRPLQSSAKIQITSAKRKTSFEYRTWTALVRNGGLQPSEIVVVSWHLELSSLGGARQSISPSAT